MIASVRGTVLAVRLDAVVVEVGGVGLSIHTTPTAAAEVRPGMTATFATSLVVREDSLTLFGFSTSSERDIFETVQTVSGVGPRLALAMVAVHTPEALRHAVATEDLNALQRVPGIGRKGAQRIVLELKDRLGTTAVAGEPVADQRIQVVEALIGLGWPQRTAQQTVDQVVDSTARVEAAEVANVLRAALRVLGAGATRG